MPAGVGASPVNSPNLSMIQYKWPSPPPPSLNDPHTLGEDIIYTIMRALAQRMGATVCVAVLALPPPPTPQLHGWKSSRTPQN